MEDKAVKGKNSTWPGVGDYTNDPALAPQWDGSVVHESIPILFPLELGKTVLDWGCGARGYWIRALNRLGYRGYGYDLNTPKGRKYFQTDLRKGPFPFGPKDFLICANVLQYFDLREYSGQLSQIFQNFTQRAFIQTSDTRLMRSFDSQAQSFVDPVWLARQCMKQGGTAVVLQYLLDPYYTACGPSVYWIKDLARHDVWDELCRILDKHQECWHDELFSIEVV